jgi:ribose transport system ATP-binding protein
MPQELLQLSRIGKTFGSNRVLDQVCFDLNAGEVHVLAGENGAGKSTLIKILAGIYQEYDGTVELAGRRVRFATPQEAKGKGISVIHQEMSLVDSMSVTDNIFLGRELAGRGGWWLDRKAQLERALDLCGQLDLDLSDEDLSRPVGPFSPSVKNRIEIAKALCTEARILVMDEPTSALNRMEVERLFLLIEALKRKGCGIVYISHRMEEIYRVADRITVLRDGKWVGTARKEECPEPKLIQWPSVCRTPIRRAAIPCAVFQSGFTRAKSSESPASRDPATPSSSRGFLGPTGGCAGEASRSTEHRFALQTRRSLSAADWHI